MNHFAYLLTGLAIRTITSLSKAKINIYGKDKIPKGPVIFVANHFTRLETLVMPSAIFRITGIPTWSLADFGLFQGTMGALLDKVGAISTKAPDRDLLIVRTLLTNEASWIIYPEGKMVKNKKIFEKGQFLISFAGHKHPPHSGAASLAIRTEFYRQRLHALSDIASAEADRLIELFQIDSMESVSPLNVHIVPVNITYYPIRAVENAMSKLADSFIEEINERALEELMAEGTMLLSGVDMDIRFGEPIDVETFMKNPGFHKNISAEKKIAFNEDLCPRRVMEKAAFDLTQKYMESIYSMTTVNHDHLFASILKISPHRKIDEYDLRQRVFLAATSNLDKMGINIHKSLESDQLHLLTDDQYHKYNDFISLVLGKNIAEKKGDALVKNTSRFSVAFTDAVKQGHRVRIDNPISIMANEVEPLSPLQKKLRSLSWKPGFLIRKKIAKDLIKKSLAEYKKDYETFYIEGESKKEAVGAPFLIKKRYSTAGVLLIHGYLAAPEEVRELAEHLAQKGLSVYAPRLKGHGTSPENLAQISYGQWIESALTGYAIIRNSCRNVVIGGFSAGGGIALELASRIKDIKGIFAVCPPFKLQDFSAKFVPAVTSWNKFMKIVGIDKAQKEFIENIPENPDINYSRNPIAGVKELEMMMDTLPAKLPGIQIPSLIIQAEKDPVVDPKGSRAIYEMLGSKRKEYMSFNYDRHVIISGENGDRVHAAISNFINRLDLH